MARRVRIVDDPDGAFEVLCETETTKVLVNPRARLQRTVAALETRLADARAELAAAPQQDDAGEPRTSGP